MKSRAETLRSLGKLIVALKKANPNASSNWVNEFVRSPKLRFGQYMRQIVDNGLPDECDMFISKIANEIDPDSFSALPDTLSEPDQGIVWLGYYQCDRKMWIPEKLRQAVEDSHMTQAQISEKTGIPQSRISAHIAGKVEPRPATQRKYEELFGLEQGSFMV